MKSNTVTSLEELKSRYSELYTRVEQVIPEEEWSVALPLIDEIRRLKQDRNAVILAHNYQTPDIFFGIADFTGDSLALAQQAADSDAEVIVQCGVHFMAETAKLLNPEKTVLIPDSAAGCSLAESIDAEGLRQMKAQYPGVPVVSYVNTSAEVKAETDICCTSANATEVVNSLNAPRIIFTPDRFLGDYVAKHTESEIILWDGSCEVHEQFTAAQIKHYREESGAYVIAHPECPPEVLTESDFVGSTSGMIAHLDEVRPERVFLVTECSMSDNVAVDFPDIEFVRPCNLCPYMKMITLKRVRDALINLAPTVEIPEAIAKRARLSVERMLMVNKRKSRHAA